MDSESASISFSSPLPNKRTRNRPSGTRGGTLNTWAGHHPTLSWTSTQQTAPRAAILDLSDACVQRGGGELSLADVLAAAPAGSDELATTTADELRLTSQLYTILVTYYVINGSSRSNAAQVSASPPKRKMLATEQLCQITA